MLAKNEHRHVGVLLDRSRFAHLQVAGAYRRGFPLCRAIGDSTIARTPVLRSECSNSFDSNSFDNGIS